MERSRSCPVEGSSSSAFPPAEFFNADDGTVTSFDADKNFFNLNEQINDATDVSIRSDPPTKAMNASPLANRQSYNTPKKQTTDSPTAVGDVFKSSSSNNNNSSNKGDMFTMYISKEDNEDGGISTPNVIKRNVSDVTLLHSNTTPSRKPPLAPFSSPTYNTQRRNIMGTNKQSSPQPQQIGTWSSIRQLFACGGTPGGMKEDMKDSIHEFNVSMRQKGSNLKENVKQRGVDTVEEVRGSFGDLGLTVKQVFSPYQNAKTGTDLVVKKVRTKLGKKSDDNDDVEDEYEECTDDDENFDDDDSESGSSLAYTESNVESNYLDDEVSQGSGCKEVTSWVGSTPTK
jgi:hypothetical protein